jgi:hypothetical protein
LRYFGLSLKQFRQNVWQKTKGLPKSVMASDRGLSINLEAPSVLYIGQAFRYSPENAFYIFNQKIYFII